ncbi:amino acid permease [Amycolatopsis sp. DSM 110486]|uniref:amino acid permease n=1 Tax=Amycolatopsis sp. DSM 110486 TaxID=2865832 RepID=UPI001C6A5F72|nr:amino acid permease [Amycolatopsis sp. DSM 110486]QYN22360.1 amino acid permease [Amycolatopsis sp. DSM 110486]
MPPDPALAESTTTADYLAPIVHLDPSPAGAAVMLASTVMGLANLRSNAWITGVFLAIELIAVVVVSVLGFAHADRSPAVLWTLGISALVILVPVVAITLADTGSLGDVDLTALVVSRSGSTLGTVISLCIAAAIVNAVIVMVIQNSRVLYASGRDRAWPDPVNRALSVVSSRFGSPWVATLVVGLSEAVLCFVPVETLSGVTGVAVVALYLAIAITVLGARRAAHRGPHVWRMPGWPVIPVVVVLALGYVLVEQTALDLGITAAVLVVSGVYWLCYLRRRSGRWLVTVPGH